MTDHDQSCIDEGPFDLCAASMRSGTPTGIGSLPHGDSAAAVAFELAAHPELPAMPTLPRRDASESMLAQAGWEVPGVRFGADGSLSVEVAALDPAAPTGDAHLLGEPFATWRAFFAALAATEPERTQPIKVQLTGPVTFGLTLVDAGAPPDVAFAVAARAVRDRSRALLDLAGASVPSAPVLVVLDEPALVGGLRPDLPLGPDAIIDLLSGTLAHLERRAATGVHCCGPADWRVVLASGPRVLSLPVGAGTADAASALVAFIESGGWIAWGAVPTSAPLGDHPSRYWKQLSNQWCDLVRAGCDPMALRAQTLLTPECGLALHDVDQAAHVLDLCRELSQRMHDQALGVRLSVGA
ncbi:MAG: hypothetical protein ABI276_00140 [Acidimicrobiales bacterium]